MVTALSGKNNQQNLVRICWTVLGGVFFLFCFIFNDDRLSSQYDHLFWKVFIMISVNIYDEIKHSKIYS